MKPCPDCGTPNAYVGLVSIECPSRKCARYSAKWAALVRPRTGDVTLPPPIGTRQPPSLPYRTPAAPLPAAEHSTTRLRPHDPPPAPIIGRRRGPRTCLCGMYLLQYSGQSQLQILTQHPMDLDAVALAGAGEGDILFRAMSYRTYEPMLPVGGGIGPQARYDQGFPAALATVANPLGLRRVFTVEAGDQISVEFVTQGVASGRHLSVIFYGYELSEGHGGGGTWIS